MFEACREAALGLGLDSIFLGGLPAGPLPLGVPLMMVAFAWDWWVPFIKRSN